MQIRRVRLLGAALIAPFLGLGAATTGHAQPASTERPATAEASGTTTVAGDGTWCNDDRIVVNDDSSASPYPSSITVDGAGNTITEVTVELVGVNHTYPDDIEVMLVGPTGQSLVLMSDSGGIDEVTAVDLAFDDAAPDGIADEGPLTTGSYRPTNADEDDEEWAPPAPLASDATELAVFDGSDPNGTWSLYIADDASGDVGAIDGGWCLSIDHDDVAGVTATALTSSPNPSPLGGDAAFTASVTSDGAPVTEGTVTFSDGPTALGEVDVDADGRAVFTTDSLAVGRHTIAARYGGGGGFGPSRRTVVHSVTTLADGMWCNRDLITIPGSGPASPYRSQITVDGAGDTISGMTVELGGITHGVPEDLGVMLVGPSGQSLVLMSDTGGSQEVTGAALTFSDAAPDQIPEDSPLTSGSYRPSNLDDGYLDVWQPPAPPDSGATALGAFDGTDPNGTWSLYVMDGYSEDSGWIDGGWCLSIDSADVAGSTTTALASDADPSVPGLFATFTATVTSGGEPVTEGTVTFSDGETTLAEVDVDANGRADFSTKSLAVGRHAITARYDGGTDRAPSSRTITHTVTTIATDGYGTWCNRHGISAPDYGVADPYPSSIMVQGLPSRVTGLTVELGDLHNGAPSDLEVMLVGPAGQNLALMSDAGDGDNVTGVDLTFDDAAATAVPDYAHPLTTGTYRPSNPSGVDLPAPAPADSGATELATFNDSNPNGTWNLYVYDHDTGGSGWIDGWCLNIDTAISQTTTELESSLNPSTVGQPVSFTATVTNSFTGETLTEGSVLFYDGASPISEEVPLDANGQATVETSTLAAGLHGIRAAYQPLTPDFAASAKIIAQTVEAAPTATALESSVNPSTVGQPVTFTATVTSGADPVTAGTVTFKDGDTILADGVALGAHGRATVDTSTLTAGDHSITASYVPSADYAASDASYTQTVVRDTAGPEAHPAVSPAPNAAGWQRGPVTVRWNWTDQGAGIDPGHCAERTTSRGEGEITITATCADLAGNETTATRTVKVDSAAPTVTIASPTAGRFTQDAAVRADYACADQVSTVASCTGTVADGARIDTSTPGHFGFAVTAVDRAGNERTTMVTYSVATSPTCHGQRATIVGTAGNDVITGTSGADVIVTGGGRDSVRARGGDDTVCSGAGRDIIAAGPGDDAIDTGSGRDSGFGGTGDDTLTGRASADILSGGLGADTIRGNRGADSLIGYGGDDILNGGADTDTCNGGAGTDQQASCEVTQRIP